MYCIQRAKYMNIEYDQKLKGKIYEDRIWLKLTKKISL